MPTQNAIRLILFCILIINLLITACATHRDLYEIIEKKELPVYEGELTDEPLSLRVLFHVLNDGSVSHVRILKTSGDSQWDSAAADSMLKWRFASNTSDSSIWVSKNITVHLLPSKTLNLGELITSSEHDANVLYSRLRAGVSFLQLMNEFRDNTTTGITGRFPRDVDTAQYPVQVSKILVELETGQFTRPLQVHGKYIIFKRFGNYMPSE